ncbi:MAG: hypothetical protein R3224_09280 [Balneolaceae bacterium]|nr:hypothetical protein [Balneolaceae bacterium]
MPLNHYFFRATVLLVLFILCSSFSNAADRDSGIRASVLDCQPDTLDESTVLRLTMPVPHGGDLGIIDPEGTYYFAFRDGKAEPEMTPQPDFLYFEKQPVFEINPSAFRLLPYVYGAEDAVRVFREPGTYRIRLSQNLETDDGTKVHECRVLYRSK